MQLTAFADLGNGRFTTAAVHLTRPDGEVITVPAPMYRLEQHMAAVLEPRINEIDQVVLDLDRWFLRDLSRNRATGLTISGRPDSDIAFRLAHRYVHEARHFPQHELTDWAERVVSELRAEA